jgi:glutathione S-transferase
MPALTLVSHPTCPYVQRAAIALLEKGVPFERVDIDLEAKPAWFLAKSPLGKVPILLVGDDDVLFESAVIAEYVEETTATPLHPADPLARAKHRALVEYAGQALVDSYQLLVAADEPSARARAESLRAKLAWVEGRLGGGPFFAGERFSFVDAAFAPLFRPLPAVEAAGAFGLFEGVPKLLAWSRVLEARPSVRGAVPADYDALLWSSLAKRGSWVASRRP